MKSNKKVKNKIYDLKRDILEIEHDISVSRDKWFIEVANTKKHEISAKISLLEWVLDK